MKGLSFLSSILLLTAMVGGAAHAQSFPSKPIRIVVPFGAGAGVDILARGVAKELSGRLGQPVVVDNRPGAGGNIGTDSVAKAEPNGYTLVMGSNGPLAANVSLYDKLPFDPAQDLAPVVLMGRLPMILLAGKSTTATSVADVIQEAKSHPGTLNFGASNTTARVWVELIKSMAGIDVATVLYKNVGGMVTDLMGGQIQYAFENVGPSMPLIRAGKIKAVAVTSPRRAGFAPDIPTLAESGLTRHELVVWLALFGPKGMPAEIVARLNKEVNEILRESPEVRELSASIGMEPAGGSPGQLADYHRAEIAKWRELVDTTGVRLE